MQLNKNEERAGRTFWRFLTDVMKPSLDGIISHIRPRRLEMDRSVEVSTRRPIADPALFGLQTKDRGRTDPITNVLSASSKPDLRGRVKLLTLQRET